MAFGAGTINSLGAAANDLFSIDTHRTKAQGLRLEAKNYDLASEYAIKNEKFTEVSTAIKQAQTDREIYKTIGGQQADVAGAGFAASGSALDLMRDSASQGALVKAVGAAQGLITEEGYRVQAESYKNMGEAARLAAQSEDNAADNAPLAAVFHAAAGIASIFSPVSIDTPTGYGASSSMGDPTGLGGLY